MRNTYLCTAAVLLGACSGARTTSSDQQSDDSTPVFTGHTYNATATTGDFMVIRVDQANSVIEYDDITTGESGEAPFIDDNTSGIGKTINDPNGKLLSFGTIDGVAIVVRAAGMGPNHDQPAIIFGLEQAALTKADLAGQRYNFAKLRTQGGVELGQLTADGADGIDFASYAPFFAQSGTGSPGQTGTVPAESLADDAGSGTITQSGPESAVVFGVPSGSLGFAGASGAFLASPEAASTELDPGQIDFYGGFIYEKKASLTGEEGVAQVEDLNVEVFDGGDIKIQAGSRTIIEAHLVPFDSSWLHGTDSSTSLTESLPGVFLLQSQNAVATPFAFAIFMNQSIVIATFAPDSSTAGAYDFIYAVGLQGVGRDLEKTGSDWVFSTHQKWAYVLTDASFYYSSPAVAADGTVYIGSGHCLACTARPADGYYLYAFNPDGSLKWKLSTGDPESIVRGSPALAPDGSIYFVVEYAPTAWTKDYPYGYAADSIWYLWKANPDGTQAWEQPLFSRGVEVGTITPAVGADGTVYMQAGNGRGTAPLKAINPDGTEKWASTECIIGGMSSPLVGPDGTIYGVHSLAANTYVAGICAAHPDGSTRWMSPAFTYGTDPGSLGSDGTVYVIATDDRDGSTHESKLFALSGDDGSIEWTYTLPCIVASMPSSPAVGSDGTIYFGTKLLGTVYAVNPDGTLKWSYTVPSVVYGMSDFYSSPAIGKDGTIYLGNETAMLVALNPDGTLKWRDGLSGPLSGGGFNYSSAAIIDDGTLYIGTNYGVFAAIKTDSLGLDTAAAWPKYRFDNSNDGRKH